MTTDERKRGLRAAVSEKIEPRLERHPHEVALLWEVIDSLVDECAGSITMEYRCLWEEKLAGVWYPFSGKVQTAELCLAEAELRRHSAGYRMVCIEARQKSDLEWIHPSEVLEF